MDPGFLEVDNTVQYCNTQESDCKFLVDPGFLEVDNGATRKNISLHRMEFYLVSIGFN